MVLPQSILRPSMMRFYNGLNSTPFLVFFCFVAVYLIATVFFIPGSVLTLAAGYIFSETFSFGIGIAIASLAVFLGASAGAIIAFILGRYILRDWVGELTKKYPIFEAIDAAMKENGFRIMALLRLSPIIPFNALNYISGLTGISLSAYSSACFAILPGTVVYVLLGASAGSIADSSSSGNNDVVRVTTIVVGVVFGFLAIVVASYYAKLELNKIIERQNDDLENSNATDVVPVATVDQTK